MQTSISSRRERDWHTKYGAQAQDGMFKKNSNHIPLNLFSYTTLSLHKHVGPSLPRSGSSGSVAGRSRFFLCRTPFSFVARPSRHPNRSWIRDIRRHRSFYGVVRLRLTTDLGEKRFGKSQRDSRRETIRQNAGSLPEPFRHVGVHHLLVLLGVALLLQVQQHGLYCLATSHLSLPAPPRTVVERRPFEPSYCSWCRVAVRHNPSGPGGWRPVLLLSLIHI